MWEAGNGLPGAYCLIIFIFMTRGLAAGSEKQHMLRIF